MSLQSTPRSGRVHVGFFGRRNAGKSSVVNAVSGQMLSVVSPVKGTTTDPVYKAMELLPLGPVMLMDAPGFDDEGDLGQLRVAKAREVLAKADLAVLVAAAGRPLDAAERQFLTLCQARGLPALTVYNKCDLTEKRPEPAGDAALYISAKTGEGIPELKARIAALAPAALAPAPLLEDLVAPGAVVVLVTPIDSAAPKGRMILPQQQTLRALLDVGALSLTVQPAELPAALSALRQPPALVITDSQAFGQVAAALPQEIPLTSFSILMARHKGFLKTAIEGAAALSRLQTNDRVLIAEGCTHHRQCEDIGTVKLPGWIRSFTGKKPRFTFTSGGEFPTSLADYALVIHCGGCMLNAKEVQSRMALARAQGVPFVNYGVAIAQLHGILVRSLSLFPDLQAILQQKGGDR